MSLRRLMALLLLVLQAQACMTWKPSKLSPEQVVEKEHRIRVTLTDDTKVDVRDPWVRADTLGGKRLTVLLDSGVLDRSQSIPLDSVAMIATEELSVVSQVIFYTIALPVAAAGALVVGFVYVLSQSDEPIVKIW